MESFWLCDDCLFAAIYDDYSAVSCHYQADAAEARIDTIQASLIQLSPISADFDADAGWGIDPFSRSPCDGCGSPLHGQRHRFTRL